jgi:hypothetical protein
MKKNEEVRNSIGLSDYLLVLFLLVYERKGLIPDALFDPQQIKNIIKLKI